MGFIDAADALGEGHVDEIVDTAANGEADVTGGPQVGNPGGTGGEVILEERYYQIYTNKCLVVTKWFCYLIFFT